MADGGEVDVEVIADAASPLPIGGADAGPPMVRMFFTDATEAETFPTECADTSDCGASERCYRLARELGVCDRDASDQGCSSEECSCGIGGGPSDGSAATCLRGQRCVTYEEECSCAPNYITGCVDTGCVSDTDCVDGTVCNLPSYMFPGLQGARCLTPLCASDADCVDGPRGRCSLLLHAPVQAGDDRLVAVRCVYEYADADPDVCQGTSPSWLSGSHYYCGALDP